ncbi:MAG: hypothetical protein LBT89_11055 [Planctomycetaceae bacterium]|nr:hypothetical protein [Planctomycetaceae bacterium]
MPQQDLAVRPVLTVRLAAAAQVQAAIERLRQRAHIARLAAAETQAAIEALRPVLTARLAATAAQAVRHAAAVNRQGKAVRWFVLPANMLARAAGRNVPLTEYPLTKEERNKTMP